MKLWLSIVVLLFSGLASAADSTLADLLRGRGLWIQSPSKVSAADLDDYRKMGVRRLHIMVTAFRSYRSCESTVIPAQKGARKHLVDLIKQSKEKGFGVVATVFVGPSRKQVESLLASNGTLAALVEAGADGLEYDLEGEWSESAVCGYKDHRDAVKQIVEKTRALRPSLHVGVTTHLGRAGDRRIGLKNFDWIAMQAYSVCSPTKGCSSFDHKIRGPGPTQALVSKATNEFPGLVVVGLASYYQQWPGHSVAEAMSRSLDAVSIAQQGDKRIAGHTYWSSSWLPPNSSQTKFLVSSSDRTQ